MNSLYKIFFLLVVLCFVNPLPLPESSMEIKDDDSPDYRLGVRYDEYPVSTELYFA